MGSRIRENVKHFFECFCEIVPKTDDKEAWIIQQYPDTYKDQQVLKAVPKFAYPCKFENVRVQHYSFVFTDIESKWTFGFCRHDPKTETALVVLSYLPWHQAFYKFLNNIAVLLHSPRSDDLRDFLYETYRRKVPESGGAFCVPFNKGESTFNCECPDRYKLPSIPENRNLTEYYNAVEMHNMMAIFASMLNERRIIFTSRKLDRLSACVQSANDIIYPMIWQHIFIPVLPQQLVDYLLAPMPFLIGVPYEVLKAVHKPDIGDVVILDADSNRVETPFNDINSLPPETVSFLKKQLRNRETLFGDGISRTFLRALVQLIGGYREALLFQEGQLITFCEKAFIESRPVTMQPFLRKMLQLQIFQQFIEERLEMLNKGEGFTDEFEMEIHIHSEKSSSKLKQQYKDWTATMKKEGSAFLKSFKDKANPAVKTAVKSVKEGHKGVKSAYKGFKSKFRESQGPEYLERGMKLYGDGLEKPQSAPNSPTGKRRPFTAFGVPKTYRKERQCLSAAVERPHSSLSPDSTAMSPDTPDRSQSATPSLEIPSIELFSELNHLFQLHPEGQKVVESPPIDRSLKPVRSLESFKHSSSTSPEGWASNTTSYRSRTGAPPLTSSPQNHFFSNSYSSDNTSSMFDTTTNSLLLQTSPTCHDDVFAPVPPPRPLAPKDLFGLTPFVVGGGQNENGDTVFLVASENSVDMVKLSPPAYSPRRSTKKEDKTEDLIRLDSISSDLDDFDPLLSKDRNQITDSSPESQTPVFTKGLSNPLYQYYVPSGSSSMTNGSLLTNHNITPEKKTLDPASVNNDQYWLKEYGLDFDSYKTKFDTSSATSTNFNNSVKQQNWDTFN